MRMGGPAPPPGAQLALTGSGADSVLLPIHLQAEVVHRAIGQHPGDSQLQEQGQQAYQSFGPGCRAGQSWSAGKRVEGQLGVPRVEATWGDGRKGTQVRMAGCLGQAVTHRQVPFCGGCCQTRQPGACHPGEQW